MNKSSVRYRISLKGVPIDAKFQGGSDDVVKNEKKIWGSLKQRLKLGGLVFGERHGSQGRLQRHTK
jgi:hypothetical protein